MLTIRDEQFKQLAAVHLERDLVRYLRQRFPQALAKKPDAELAEVARLSRDLGARHGIDNDRDIGTLADLTVMYGPDVEKKVWANEVLSHPELTGPQKVEVLRLRVRKSGARI